MSGIRYNLYYALTADYVANGKRSALYQWFHTKRGIAEEKVDKRVNDFLNEAGFSFKRLKDTVEAESNEDGFVLKEVEHPKKPPANSIKTEILELYADINGLQNLLAGEGAAGYESAEAPDRETVGNLFRVLVERHESKNRQEHQDCNALRIPLVIDPLTGCSIHLLGSDYIEKDPKKRPGKDAGGEFPCAFIVFLYKKKNKEGFMTYIRWKEQFHDYEAAYKIYESYRRSIMGTIQDENRDYYVPSDFMGVEGMNESPRLYSYFESRYIAVDDDEREEAEASVLEPSRKSAYERRKPVSGLNML